MTPAALALARRLAAHPKVQWRPGMLTVAGTTPGPGSPPDLDDWATVGCLLGMLERARAVVDARHPERAPASDAAVLEVALLDLARVTGDP